MLRRFTAFFLLLLLLTPFAADAADKSLHLKARVLNVLIEERIDGAENNLPNKSQVLEVEILQDPYKGEKHELQYSYSTTNLLLGSRMNTGDQVMVLVNVDGKGKVENLFVQEPVREIPLYTLIGLFALAHLIVGGFKGIKALITLAITGALLYFVLMPLILKGYNPILVTVLISFAVTLIAVIVLTGWGFKSWATIIGTFGGLMLSALMAYIFGTWSRIIGLDMEEMTYLINLSQSVAIDFRGILFSGIIIGSLGAVLAVTISIASSVEEIYFANPNQTRRQLFQAGMNVGRDIMGTMSNTLILAYAGTMIPLMLLYSSNQLPYTQTINADHIASEVIRSIAGSIGLISAIPLTAFLAAILMSVRRAPKNKTDKETKIEEPEFTESRSWEPRHRG